MNLVLPVLFPSNLVVSCCSKKVSVVR